MAQLMQPFNALDYQPATGSSPQFPVGDFLVACDKSEVNANNAGTGGFIVYEAVIAEGPHKGTRGVIRFNVYSASMDAVKYANEQYSAFCHVTGVLQPKSTEQHHNIPFRINVGLQKVKSGEEDKGYTEVKKFFDANGNEPKHGQMPNQGGGQQQQNTGFGNQQQPQQPQQNNGGFGQQQQQPQNGFGQQPQNQGGFGQANNVPMDQGQQQPQGGFGQQAQQQPQNNGGFGQQQQPQTQGGGNWAPNQQQQPQGNGGGGWGQQRG